MYCITQFPPSKAGEPAKVEIVLSSWMKDDIVKCPPNHTYTKCFTKINSISHQLEIL
jgi:hypothetical protein